jgi:hypothetical protein
VDRKLEERIFEERYIEGMMAKPKSKLNFLTNHEIYVILAE